MRKRDELVHGCMAKAHDDEWTFVLLGRDEASPVAIRAWISERLRLRMNKATDANIIEAEKCAEIMTEEVKSVVPRTVDVLRQIRAQIDDGSIGSEECLHNISRILDQCAE